MSTSDFRIISSLEPRGDQPRAIDCLCAATRAGAERQVLLGITGSGKTFTMANVIERLQRPTLVIAHNKTLAAQLFAEFRELFPENAVEYFVSYYDYYQPEAYVPRTDTYIEKDASINEQIERMRNSATRSLLTRRDVLLVASVSCIYGLGSPDAYEGMSVALARGQQHERDDLLRALARIQYQRCVTEFRRGTFRVRGDVVEVFPVYEEAQVIRLEFFDRDLEAITLVDSLTGAVVEDLEEVTIFPGSHYITPEERLARALEGIEKELASRLLELRSRRKLLEAQRLEQRTLFDLEMLRETGVCSGIENYSRHLDGRRAGEAPATLLSYFPDDLLVFIDESHQTLPQIEGMYRGDRARKETLIDYGFRLPSALDNRPLRAEEFQRLVSQVVFVSATPGEREQRLCTSPPVELVIRPTGLLDPAVEVRPTDGQIDDLLSEIRLCEGRAERVLVTTLTKRMAEDLTDYYRGLGVRVRYMHSDIDAIERTEIIRDLRRGEFDVLVGINLLREGLDLPEVALVAILDADKEGFLRSATSLIQTFGRAARNENGRVLLYADRTTASMQEAMSITGDRRRRQAAYNAEHGIEPRTIRKEVHEILQPETGREDSAVPGGEGDAVGHDPTAIRQEVERLRAAMLEAAANLEFEKAAELRDAMLRMERLELALG